MKSGQRKDESSASMKLFFFLFSIICPPNDAMESRVILVSEMGHWEGVPGGRKMGRSQLHYRLLLP